MDNRINLNNNQTSREGVIQICTT